MRSTIGQAEQKRCRSQAFFSPVMVGGVSGCPARLCGGGGEGELAAGHREANLGDAAGTYRGR